MRIPIIPSIKGLSRLKWDITFLQMVIVFLKQILHVLISSTSPSYLCLVYAIDSFLSALGTDIAVPSFLPYESLCGQSFCTITQLKQLVTSEVSESEKTHSRYRSTIQKGPRTFNDITFLSVEIFTTSIFFCDKCTFPLGIFSFCSWECVILGCIDVWLVQLQCSPMTS